MDDYVVSEELDHPEVQQDTDPSTWPAHPAAELFPRLEPDDLAELTRDIADRGLLVPVLTYQGQILDGRNRLRACLAAGVRPRFEAYAGDDPWGHVAALNLARRHLTPSQRALIATRMLEPLQAEARERQRRAGGDRRSDSAGVRDPVGTPGKASAHAARLVGVSARLVEYAAQVTEHGEAELVRAVDDGLLGLEPASRISGEPPAVQREVVAQLEAGVSVGQALAAMNPPPAAAPPPHVAQATGDERWFTPRELIEAARDVLGEIDLDPASEEEANRTIQATRFYTVADDGLAHPWAGRVWLNPPYSRDKIGRFVDRLVHARYAGQVSEAVLLVNNGTETAWAQLALHAASAVCFLRGRVRFHRPGGSAEGAPLQGQLAIYFGDRPAVFAEHFGRLGVVARMY